MALIVEETNEELKFSCLSATLRSAINTSGVVRSMAVGCIRSKAPTKRLAFLLWEFHRNKLYSGDLPMRKIFQVCVSMIFTDHEVVMNVFSLSSANSF